MTRKATRSPRLVKILKAMSKEKKMREPAAMTVMKEMSLKEPRRATNFSTLATGKPPSYFTISPLLPSFGARSLPC